MFRKLIYLISFVLVLGLVLTSTASATDPNLVGWWKLNETDGVTAYDSSGNGNDGILQGNPQWVSGKIGGALQFDGVGDWVDCGTPSLFVIQREITMACWIKVAQFTKPWEAFLTKGDNAYRISRSQSGGKTHMGMNGTILGWFDGTINVQDNQWHHVAGVYDGAQARIYIDGVLDTAKSNTGLINAETGALLYIGENSGNTGRQITGLIDDVRLYSRALKPVEIPVIMYGETYPFAYAPEPANGATVTTTVITLKWKPGESVASVSGHRVYLDLNEQKVTARSGCQINGVSTTDPCYPIPTPLTVGQTYYWAVDEVNDPNIWTGVVWRFTISPKIASNPVPSNGAGLVIPPVTLEWTAGAGATQHHVYFGNNWSNVNNGTGDTDKGTRTEPNFVPGSLELGETYYWRIDEFNGVKTYTGDVWSFTTIGPRVGVRGEYYNNTTLDGEPVLTRTDYNIDFDWGIMSPDPLVNTDNFSVRWISELEVPFTETYTFSIYCLSEDGVRLWVNGRQIINNWPASNPEGFEGTIDLVAGKASIKMEFYDTEWGAVAKLSWQSPSIPQQIIPIGAFSLPITALNPSPFDGATDVELTPALSWGPGMYADTHDVYFGTDFNSVSDANRAAHPGLLYYSGNQVSNSYNVGPLEFDTPYYWRVDEVNDANIWKGDVWSFTTGRYLVVDDFEGYTNSDPNIIFKIWKDGVGYSPGNGTGSQVGYRDPNYAELTIIHAGAQSMPVDYNNLKSPYYSEADRTFDTPQSWTTYGPYSLKSLTLWVRGYPASVGSFIESPPSVYTITASGTNIGDVPPLRGTGFHDEFHFGYKEITAADAENLVTIIAKVESVGNAGDTVGKAGVMIRQSLDQSSTNGLTCIRRISGGGYGAAFQRRLVGAGATTQDTNDVGITVPYWIKLELQISPGNYGNLRAYYSHTGADGTWIQLGEGSQQISGMTLPVYAGLAVTPQSTTNIRKATFSNVTITAGAAGAWNHRDIGIKSNVASPLYVTLQDSNPSPGTKTVTHPDPYILLQNTWQEWNIALSDFTGVDLTKVKKITIGVGNKSALQPVGVGTIYVDDIRLCIPRCMPNLLRPAGDFTGSDCIVDYQDLQILTNNWLISDYQVTPPVGWDPNSDPNLVGWYRFEGDLTDSSGNNNTGDPCGTSPVYVAGKIGQALSLDGVDDYVAVTRTVQDDFTLMAWIKTTTPGAQAGTRSYQGSGLIWSDVAGGADDFIMAVLGTKLSFATGPADQDTTSSGDVVTGQWVHVAAARTRSSGRVELFINGMLDPTVIHSNTSSLSANPKINIGANTVDSRYYTGLIDDVRIYSRALSQGEVAYLAGKTAPFTQPLYLLLTPQNPAINTYNDGTIDLRDYAVFADTWLEVLLWP